MFEENRLEDGYGRLLAEGVQDVRHLKNKAGLPTLCQRQVLRSSPYAIATEF